MAWSVAFAHPIPCPVQTLSVPLTSQINLKIWGFLISFTLKSGSITQVAFVLVCRSPAKLSKEWTNPPKRPAPTAIRADSHQISNHDLKTGKNHHHPSGGSYTPCNKPSNACTKTGSWFSLPTTLRFGCLRLLLFACWCHTCAGVSLFKFKCGRQWL